jgi:hypothetical protein
MVESKPTWVFVAGIYRSASTTQYLITRDVVKDTESGTPTGYHTEGRLEEYDVPGSGRYVVSKVFKFLPQTSELGATFLKEKRLKAVCTVRDPRDIVVSMRTRNENRGRHTDQTFDFETTVTKSFPVWLGQLEQWIDLGPEITMVTRFEDLIANLLKETRRISEHLDITLPDGHDFEIAKRYSIQAQRERAQEVRAEGKKADPWLPSIPSIVFGTAGMHVSWLSPSERQLVEKTCRGFMKRFGYL